MSVNQDIFLIINSFANQNIAIDIIVIYIAKLTPFLFISIEIILFFIFKLKNEAIFSFYSMLLALLFSKTISLFYYHNRPFVDNLGVSIVEHLPDSSFPSDHTTFMMAIVISFFFYSKTKKLFYMLFAIALLGGLSRIFVGVHYPFDILAAILVGGMSSFIIFKVSNKLQMINDYILNIESKIYKYFK